MSTSAQELSLGASEQAGSVEELAVTVSEISRHVSQNARNALEASRDAGAVKNEADAGNQQMQELLAAMENIVSSSRKIRKILKTIEEIAFQTNILSLNASVEAARAGAAGKGFAVVAEEIRSLAAKSAQASTNTNTLINDSLTAAEAGSKIAAETAQAMQKVMEGVDKARRLHHQHLQCIPRSVRFHPPGNKWNQSDLRHHTDQLRHRRRKRSGKRRTLRTGTAPQRVGGAVTHLGGWSRPCDVRGRTEGTEA